MNDKRIKKDPTINVYLSPDKGSWGVFFKRGHSVVCWNDLHSWEKEKVINHMTFVLRLLKNEES